MTVRFQTTGLPHNLEQAPFAIEQFMYSRSHQDTSSPAMLSDIELARAAARWGKFTSGLSGDDKRLLDRVARGDSVKAVCFELSLGYEAMQKRMTRWQQSLGLKSTTVLLHLWATVRGFGRRADDPTLIRYAELLRHTLGYDAPTALPPADVMATSTLRAFTPVKSAAVVAREQAEQNTLALLSPVLWRVCQQVVREGAYDHSRAVGLPALHEWFRQLAGLARDSDCGERLGGILIDVEQRLSTQASLIGDDFALLLAAHDLQSPHLDMSSPSRLPAGVRSLKRHGERRSFATTFWRKAALAASESGADHLISLWHEPAREQLLDPVHATAAAIVFFRARTPAVRAAVSPVLNRIISTRQQWVTTHRVDPLQILHRQACFECGMSVVELATSAHRGDPVLTAEQLLPPVKRLSGYVAPVLTTALA